MAVVALEVLKVKMLGITSEAAVLNDPIRYMTLEELFQREGSALEMGALYHK